MGRVVLKEYTHKLNKKKRKRDTKGKKKKKPEKKTAKKFAGLLRFDTPARRSQKKPDGYSKIHPAKSRKV